MALHKNLHLHMLTPSECVAIAYKVNEDTFWQYAGNNVVDGCFQLTDVSGTRYLKIYYKDRLSHERFVFIENGVEVTINTSKLIDIFEFIK